MTHASNCVRPRSSARLRSPTRLVRIRTHPNTSERPANPNNAETTRKNLKKAESLKPTISHKTQGIRHRTRVEKKIRPKPENRFSPLSPRPGNLYLPKPARHYPFRPQNLHPTAKTTPKLTKTIHPKRAISHKTLGSRPIKPAAKKLAETLSTRENQP